MATSHPQPLLSSLSSPISPRIIAKRWKIELQSGWYWRWVEAVHGNGHRPRLQGVEPMTEIFQERTWPVVWLEKEAGRNHARLQRQECVGGQNSRFMASFKTSSKRSTFDIIGGRRWFYYPN